jgi:geranylgeranyl reductase
MCDDKDVQRLTFDSYLYKRVVPVNPWQTLKLTLLTLGAYLRGQAFAPSGYKPVPSAVRSEAEMAEFSSKTLLAATQGTIPTSSPQAKGGSPEAPQAKRGEREPILAAKK